MENKLQTRYEIEYLYDKERLIILLEVLDYIIT